MLLSTYLPIQSQIISTFAPNDKNADSDTLSVLDTIQAEQIALPWEQSVQIRLDKLVHHSMFKTSQVGLMVYDLTADSLIFKYNEQQLMRPASTLKAITAIAALDKLGADYQLKTELYYTGKIQNGTLIGDVYCVGGLDPLFDKTDMIAFADCIKSLGVDTIRGNLYADKSMKDLNTLGEGWCWDDDNPILSPLVYRQKDHFMDEFQRLVRSEGIVIEAFSSQGECPQTAMLMCQRTHSLYQVLQPMLKHSDNLSAEAVFYQLPITNRKRNITAKDAVKIVKQLLQKVGLDATRYRIADGSGLSLYNYISAELLVKVLRYAYQTPRIYNYLKPSLPLAGVDGSLRKRMMGETTKANVWAKTGTLTGVSSLAGYALAPNGHTICFAIINQGVMFGKNGRYFQDRVCHAICNK